MDIKRDATPEWDKENEGYNADRLIAFLLGGRAMGDFSVETFEKSGRENGNRFWYAHEFMTALGYDSWPSFQSVITKAMGSCAKLTIDPTEAFVAEQYIEGGKSQKTYRLTRFACFLVSMHADSKKPAVAQAKAVLAAIADQLIGEKIKEQDFGRIETRDDLKLAEKVMSGVAQVAGLEGQQFAIFKDAGFRGMYNMGLQELKRVKGVSGENAVLYDFMGLEELAGNIFRVTQTAARIKNKNLTGLAPLQATATAVGSEVRTMMIKNSGVAPEALPIDQDISKVRRKLKATGTKMNKLDKIPAAKRLK
jgi:DNA-damage-inducible protein D